MVRAEWGRLADRLLLSNAGLSEPVQKKADVRLLGVDTVMSSVYTLPRVTENLLTYTIAGVTWWFL